MKYKSGDKIYDELRTAYNMYAVPRLTIDWNMNRYVSVNAYNYPSDDTDGYDIEAYPIESITEPLRPTKGIAKAKIGEGIVSWRYNYPKDPKYYISDTEDVYKYWTSPYRTDSSGVMPLHTDGITTVRPTIVYSGAVHTNKIVIKMENSWATPLDFYVLGKQNEDDATWTTLYHSPNPTDVEANGLNLIDGTLELYLQPDGTWATALNEGNYVEPTIENNNPYQIGRWQVIRFRVDTMGAGYNKKGEVQQYTKNGTQYSTKGANSHFNLIAIEAHLVADFSDRLINDSDDFEMSAQSELYPIGTTTSNQGSFVLANEDNYLNKDNPDSLYHALLEPNAVANLEYVFTIDGTEHKVQQFKMYTDEWSPSTDEGTIEIQFEDYSKFLKEIKPRSMMLKGKPVTEIIWRVLDSVGFNDYEIQNDDKINDHTIPVFWTTGDETVWEVLDGLANATQTAIYFDGYGKLQVRTREAAYRDDAEPDWLLLGQNATDGSGAVADIISLSPDGDLEANTIDVTYKTSKWKTSSNGTPAASKVWTPESDTLVVRSSPLRRNIVSATDDYFYLDQKEAQIWPYAGKVQIDGEIISYEGKRYVYYTGSNGGQKNVAVVKSAAELNSKRGLTPPAYRFKNYITGAFKITERGVWNSDARAHMVDISGWNPKMTIRNGLNTTVYDNPTGMTHHKAQSLLKINTPAKMKNVTDGFFVTYGSPGNTGYKTYGTRLRFNKQASSPHQRGGIGMYQSGSQEDGYFVDLIQSNQLSASARKSRNEVALLLRHDGKWQTLQSGPPVAIAQDIWYDIDVYVSVVGGNHRIVVYVNGSEMLAYTTTNAQTQADSARFSLYARGKSNIDFEYAYGIARSVKEPADDFGFYDLKYGGVRGGQWEREHVYELRTRRRKIKKKKWTKETYRHNDYFFDEFGPYVHEIREFDVKFDPAPVNYAYLFSTNEYAAAPLEFNSTPFGAKFIVANTARYHAVLNGSDSITFGSTNNAVNQVFCVLGQDLIVSDDQTVTKKNNSSITKRGTVESELSSDWLQSKEMANDVGDWMAKHWSAGVDQWTAEIFGNPLIELGDVVGIDYDEQFMDPSTHRYFVTGVQNEFSDGGISTTLSLRRINNADLI